MANKTLADEIITLIQSEANNNPAPIKCTIKKIYDDNHVDVDIENGVLKYLEILGDTSVGSDGVVVFVNGSYNDAVVISVDYYSKSEIDDIIEDIISGEIDLNNYVRKDEVDINLLNNGYFKLKLDNME